MNIRSIILSLLFTLSCITALSAQFGLSYHQSALPFLGVNYELGGRLLTEFRISTDVFVDDLAPELIVAYKFGRNERADPYLGAGIRLDPNNLGSGIVVPFGLNVYPFERRQFGFHLEFAPLLVGEGGSIVRGSWGIRYRFGVRDN